MGGVVVLLAAIVPTVLLTSASAATGDPDHINFTLEGCRNDGSIVLPIGGKFVCGDAAYTTGNLGKGWNELDLVPHRVTLRNDGPNQTYSFIVAGDYKNGAGNIGWDVIGDLTRNDGLSDSGCPASATMGSLTITPSGGGVGGADQTIYRLVTLTQSADKTCVYDYYQRVALGAHNFSGSSLQSNLWNQSLDSSGIGQKRIQLPVNEILPQELTKDMSATQGSDHTWNIYKEASPATLAFENTCSVASGARSQSVQITVRWERVAATPSGPITVITHVYAKNPAARVITVSVTDLIRSGTTVLHTVNTGDVDVPANTQMLVLTHQTEVPAGTANLNDVATATYTDKVTGVAVPGNTTATASAAVQLSGVTKNQTAVIRDVESITGSGLSYSVDSVSGASGSFLNGYVAGTHTTNSVTWQSTSQSGSGSVTFTKTVYVGAGQATTGSLSDVATLTGSHGFTASANASVSISASASGVLTIAKTIPNVLTGSETDTFGFTVKNGANVVVATPSVTFTAGQTSKSVDVTGLALGSYTVSEDIDPTGKWTPQPDQPVTLGCTATVTFNNSNAPAVARVQKITVPAGDESGWEFTLTGPGTALGGDKVTTTGTGSIQFPTSLQEGSYTITETSKAGFDQTGTSGDCSFTVNYPADADRVFLCAFTNTKRGSIIVEKQTLPDGSSGSFTFTGDAAGSLSDGQQITVNNLAPGTYLSTETVLAGWDLTSIVCNDSGSASVSSGNVGTARATFRLDPGETVKCVFTNTKRGLAKVVKTVSGAAPSDPVKHAFTFQLRQGASEAAAGTVLESGTADPSNGGVINFTTTLVPGTTYQLCEQVLPGWLTSLSAPVFTVYNPSGDNSFVCSDFTVTAGQTKTFNIDNTPPPGGAARTIGYWKNWASCATSNGKQRAVLDETLVLAGGHILIGDLDVDTCLEAVRILNKSTVDTGKKMASDPAFNMAAQLLAAKLNVAAGAGACPAAVTAMNAGQALLDLVNFNGITHANMNGAQSTSANSLAQTLDKYNNNTLC